VPALDLPLVSLHDTPVRGDSDPLDTVGGWASLACALHCALLPIALAALPGVGLELLDNDWFDRSFALSVGTFGLLVLGTRLCVARARTVVTLYGCAVALLALGAFGPLDGMARGLVLGVGGTAMAMAHFVNREGLRRGGVARNVFRRLH